MKEKYEKLKQKYDLPDFEELSRNFEIDSIAKEDNIIREILKKTFEKIDFYTRIMESLIQPDSTFASMKEASGLTPTDMALVNKIFIEGMYLTRQFSEFGIEYSDAQAAEFFKSMYKEWQTLKPEIKVIMNKIKEIWKQQYVAKHDKGYFG